MTISHDAYLFEPTRFTQSVANTLAKSTSMDELYRRVRARALRVFDENTHVQRIVDAYGGWDRAGLIAEIPTEMPADIFALSFWYGVLLYEHLQTPSYPSPLGLKGEWRMLDDHKNAIGWPKEEKDLLIYGRKYIDLLQPLLCGSPVDSTCKALLSSAWEQLAPASVGGRFGWIDQHDVDKLLDRVTSAKSGSLAELTADVNDKQLHVMLYHRIIEMLEAAHRDGVGLCLVLSG